MPSKWREFLEDDNGRGSSTRLSMVWGIFVGSLVVLWLTYNDHLGADIFLTFMLASGGVYGVGKLSESSVQKVQIQADSPNQPPVVMAAPAAPNTIIQVGAKEGAAKNVDMKVEGNVSVSKN